MGWAKIANIKGPKGDPGPQAVSADAGNQARLGTDHLIFVPAVTGFLTQTAADAKYALKTAIPSLAAYITTAAADAKYALKTQLPDMSLYLLKTEAATLGGVPVGTIVLRPSAGYPSLPPLTGWQECNGANASTDALNMFLGGHPAATVVVDKGTITQAPWLLPGPHTVGDGYTFTLLGRTSAAVYMGPGNGELGNDKSWRYTVADVKKVPNIQYANNNAVYIIKT